MTSERDPYAGMSDAEVYALYDQLLGDPDPDLGDVARDIADLYAAYWDGRPLPRRVYPVCGPSRGHP